MMVVSLVLIKAVFQIRNYIQQEQYAVNTLNLVIHSVAYGFYFFPLFVSCVFYAFPMALPDDSPLRTAIAIFYAVCSFISQLLLCVILFELGKQD